MGNCFKPIDPLDAQIPRDSGIDATPVSQSGLPIIFIVGGPGAGKKTQNAKVAKKYGFLGLNCGDILRGEVLKRSERGFILARMMSEGRLIPADVLLELIKAKMLNSLNANGTNGFLLSGFPTQSEQGRLFDKQVRPPDLVIYLQVRNSLLIERVAARLVLRTERSHEYKYEEVAERVKSFQRLNKPILKQYKKVLAEIDGEPEIHVVFDNICKVIDDTLAKISSRRSQISRATTSRG